jgi:hypothetical protein
MRNANSQRANIIVRLSVLQQPPGPHVSHAEIGGGDTHSETRTIPSADFGFERTRI